MSPYRQGLCSKETGEGRGQVAAVLVLCCYILSRGDCLSEWQLLLPRALGSRYLYWEGLRHRGASASHGRPSLLWCHLLMMGAMSSGAFSLQGDGPSSPPFPHSLHLVLSVCTEQQPGDPCQIPSEWQFYMFQCFFIYLGDVQLHMLLCAALEVHILMTQDC